MGSIISTVAFPAPELPKSFYENRLENRPDLVWLTTKKGEKIPACHIRARHPLPGPRFTIIYSHGNAEDIGVHLEFIEALAEASCCDVLSYEYVGYSLSKLAGASASEKACIRSIDAAYKYCTQNLRILPEHVILHGRSIGSGPTVDLASRVECRGVMLQSPIESGARVVFNTTVSYVGYPFDIFRNYEKVSKIKAPVAIMHGTADEVVPCDNGRALHKSLKMPFDPYW
eukprot:CAMPEP_0197858726 /NCGR_PEP_ID=MMETSP1438-20131217/32740_1 /TAXON_ID=1461541 /ORGANISM="Pterosperma sp., Strain CCMP1384" /LENGTH=228 /DNA_ID=CAMNT_0043474977 /DNA_START=279 /DNA_END=962 /DNA_ORIENTATION=+